MERASGGAVASLRAPPHPAHKFGLGIRAIGAARTRLSTRKDIIGMSNCVALLRWRRRPFEFAIQLCLFCNTNGGTGKVATDDRVRAFVSNFAD
jgi:hypothetical protein